MKRENSILWQKTLGLNNSKYPELVDFLRKSFESARENASYILDKIREDFPNLTVHDITHSDSLWQVSSVIIGNNYEITPLEGYILGCAFLIHDAGLSYEAAGGKERLRNTLVWKDFYCDFEKNNDLSEDEKRSLTDFKAIRFLHANYAENIYKRLFTKEDKSSFYIISDQLLRDHLGSLIGKISASHHWNIDKVKELGTQEPAPREFPQEWRINPLKLACILRCADAGHIDSGRAPDYLYKVLELHGVSYDHWTSQNRLSQIDIDNNDSSKIMIKANIPFKKEDFSSWNVAYEALKVLDKEIKESNKILKASFVQEFQAKGVSGIDSKEELSKYLRTEGWLPCDAVIHISNVESLIKNLGGENLYGYNHKLEIVLRELIQNSRDAIAARRIIEKGFIGKIIISVEKIKDKICFSVSDNGVGMSLNTIKNYLFNFGSSFWYSDLSKIELPGLLSSGYKSVGKFGIGFYSIFMVSSEVKIETRKYDKGLDNVITVEFPNGLTLNPIISKEKSINTNVSTVVSFYIDEKKVKWHDNVTINAHYLGEKSIIVPYSSVLSNLTAGLDVDVCYKEFEHQEKCIHRNIYELNLESEDIKNWLIDVSFANYRNSKDVINYISNNYKRLRRVIYNNECIGIAAINTFWRRGYTSFLSIQTVGGLSSLNFGGDDDYIGFINGEPLSARRNVKIPTTYKNEWVKEQYSMLKKQGLSPQDCFCLPYYLGKYCLDFIPDIYIYCVNKKGKKICKSLPDLLHYLCENSFRLVFPLCDLSENRIETYLDVSGSLNKLKENDILFIPYEASDFLSLEDNKDSFPYTLLTCIKYMAKRYSQEILSGFEENVAVSSVLNRSCRGFVITVKLTK